jgi:hypothetical protein
MQWVLMWWEMLFNIRWLWELSIVCMIGRYIHAYCITKLWRKRSIDASYYASETTRPTDLYLVIECLSLGIITSLDLPCLCFFFWIASSSMWWHRARHVMEGLILNRNLRSSASTNYREHRRMISYFGSWRGPSDSMKRTDTHGSMQKIFWIRLNPQKNMSNPDRWGFFSWWDAR